MRTITTRNYHREARKRRNRAKIFGTAARPRLTLFISNKNMYAQLINDAAGKTLASVHSRETKVEKNNVENAKKLGALMAERAKKAGIAEAVLNKGALQYHGRLKAFTESVREAGLKV